MEQAQTRTVPVPTLLGAAENGEKWEIWVVSAETLLSVMGLVGLLSGRLLIIPGAPGPKADGQGARSSRSTVPSHPS